MEPVGVRGLRPLAEALEIGLHLVQGHRVDQLAQLLLAEQLAQQVAVQGECGGAPLRVRRVALVHVRGHVVEQQRRGERRGALGLHLHERELARVEASQQLLQAGQVEHVTQALAVGLEDDRELAVALGHLEQRLRLEPLLPQRGAPARVGPGEQQGACGVLTEAGAEERGAGQLSHHQLLHDVRLDHHQIGRGRLVRIGKVDDDPVVRPDRVGLEAEVVADARRQRQRPGRVHPTTERREDAQAPVADLVPESLHHDAAVRGHHAGGVALLAKVGGEVLRRPLVQVVVRGQVGRLAVHGLAGEGADRLAQLLRAADPVAAPEGHGPRSTGGGGHDHPVAGDLLDPPGAGPEEEGLTRAGLVHHLLVQLAHPPAVGQVHAVEAAVGDRARVGDGELASALARPHRVRHPVPHDPRAELGELLARVAPVEHVEHAVHQLARELGEGVGAAHQVVQLARAPLVSGGHDRHHLLGQHVERVARHHRGLDVAVAHALDHHGAFEKVGPELGEDPAPRHLAHAVARAPDALQAGGDRLGRLHLDHQVHRPHVDAQLERRGGHQAGQLARLEEVLHHQPLLARQRPVVCPCDRRRLPVLAGQLVQPHGQTLGPAAAVHEHDGGPVLLHQSQQLGIDRRPDRALGDRGLAETRAHQVPASGRRAHALERRIDHVVGVRLAHVLHRHVDLHVERLADARVHHLALPAGADQEAAHLLERALRGRKTDALERPLRLVLEALERQRQVGPALGAGHGVNLVHDHGLRVHEELPRPRGEHQVERLRCGDQHVGGRAQHRLSLSLRGVARPDGHGHVSADPLERRAQVLLDVVGEGLQRRDVDQPRAPVALRRRLGHQTVEGPQEGGQRLARPGGR